MNISELFIRRSVMTTLLMVGLFIFGLLGYRSLPISDLPNVDLPTILVTASLPGASPETMASSVATPLERQFSSIAGITMMNSSSSLGNTQITLQFDLDRDIDSAAQDVQAAISAANRQLPANMPSPPTYRKVNPAAQPILYLALSSKALPLSAVDEYAENLLAQRISMIEGVAQVNVFGSQKYAVRVQVNPDILASRGIGLDQIAQAIQSANVNLPTGSLNGSQQSFLIQTNGQLETAAAYRPLIVAYRNSSPVRLDTVAEVLNSVENDKVASWYNNDNAIILAVQRQPGSNTIEVMDNIKKILPQFESQLPAAIKLDVVYDRTQSIRHSVNEVQFTLILAAVLVIIVIFLFLRSLSATLIPAVALPLSVIGTFAFMHLLNFNLDNMSLLALTLCVGYVIDDAIVVLENIYRHIEAGQAPMAAAIQGAREIGFTVLSMTLSLAAVFIPVLFMGGILGRLLFEFGVTICIAIILSGAISLTLTPMLCSRFLKPSAMEHKYAWQHKVEAIFNASLHFYERSLQWVLRHRTLTMASFLLSLIVVAGLYIIVPKGFMPSEDTGQLFAYTEADSYVSFQGMAERQQAVARIIKNNPNVDGVMSVVGTGGASTTGNSGRLFIRLKPRDERNASADEIVEQLRPQLEQISGIKAYLQNVPSIALGPMSKSTYQLTLQDTNADELAKWSTIFVDKMRKLPGFQDVNSSLIYSGPQVKIDIDRDKAAALGISPQQIQSILGYAFGSQEVSTIYTTNNDYQVILELQPQFQRNPSILSQLYISANSGTLVPLSTITKISQTDGPLAMTHQGQLPAVIISYSLKSGVSLGEAVASIIKLKKQLLSPASLIVDFQGTAQMFNSSVQGLGLLLLIAIFVIYIVLGILYESFIHPLTILSGLPAAGAGALLALIVCGSELDFYSFIGILMLVGIVKKNAIMMIDFALEAQRKEQKPPLEAIYQACILRFRPIMMTTMAALLGALPIALAFGAGAESRRPLGIAVVGGLLISQFLTLYITPVIYLYFEKFSQRRGLLQRIPKVEDQPAITVTDQTPLP